jgi:hypothetical protein
LHDSNCQAADEVIAQAIGKSWVNATRPLSMGELLRPREMVEGYLFESVAIREAACRAAAAGSLVAQR